MRRNVSKIFDENNAKLRDNAKDRDVVILKWRGRNAIACFNR
jgi:hypothetical protein